MLWKGLCVMDVDALSAPKKKRSWFLSGWLVGCGILALTIVLVVGVPPTPLKTVSVVYAPGADKNPLAIFVQPPLAVMESDGETQPLAIQFTNHADTTVPVGTVEALPASCFQLKPQGAAVASLTPQQTRVGRYELSVDPACEGQRALTIQYSAPKTAIAAAATEAMISTSPILITTSKRLAAERFVHAANALAVPIVLALIALLIDRYQKRKEQAQKDLDTARDLEQQKLQRKLDVWKLIFPIIDGYIRKHYVLISRQMDLVLTEMTKTPVHTRYLMCEVIVLRSAFDRLGDEVGGFSFQDSSAEGICSILSNHLLARWEETAGDRRGFAKSARAVCPTDRAAEADEKLTAMANNDVSIRRFHAAFEKKLAVPATMDELKELLKLTVQFLDFENNALWYPWWYSSPPTLDFKAISFEKLGLKDEVKKNLYGLLKSFEKEVPSECRL
jgi:hypothetical protein